MAQNVLYMNVTCFIMIDLQFVCALWLVIWNTAELTQCLIKDEDISVVLGFWMWMVKNVEKAWRFGLEHWNLLLPLLFTCARGGKNWVFCYYFIFCWSALNRVNDIETYTFVWELLHLQKEWMFLTLIHFNVHFRVESELPHADTISPRCITVILF